MSEAVATKACPGSCGKTEDVDVSAVDAMVKRIGRRSEDLIPLLQAIQKKFNYLPPPALERLCELTDITPDAVTGVSTFYSQFRHYPVGKHIIQTCVGTACHVSGANIIDDTLRQHLKIKEGEHTTEDGQFTTEKVACLGCCMLAPVVQIDDVIYGNVEPWNIPKTISDFLATTEAKGVDGENLVELQNAVGDVRLCTCTGCAAGGAHEVFAELKKVVDELGLPVGVRNVGCSGISFQTPLVEVAVYNEARYRYGRVKPGEVRQILAKHFRPANWFKRAGARIYQLLDDLLSDEAWQPPTRFSKDVRGGDDMRYVDSQKRVVTEYSGELNPVNIEDYIAHEGFQAMEKCLKELEPDEIIKIVSDSGLRGRGGAGFPTGTKWGFAKGATGDLKYIICNGDEGDPGAFMDRMILESFPFRLLEGMVIAAKAVGATEGYLYIRAEYPLATERINKAIAICEERGYLGEDILGTGMKLKLKVVEGAGAFVCGEETALMSAIEGGRGMPRFRPPFPRRRVSGASRP